MNLSQAIDSFTNQLAANGRSPLTLETYGRDLNLLLSFAGDITVSDLTPDLINRFVLSDAVQLSSAGEQKSEVTIGRTKAALKSFGRFLADVGALSADPARGLQIKRVSRKQPAFFTAAEQKRLLKAVSATAR